MVNFKLKEIKVMVLVVAGIIAIVSLNAIFRNYVSYRVNLLQLRVNKNKLSTLEHQREGYVKQVDAFNADKQKLETMLFDENGVAEFLQRMPQEATQSGVRVLRMNADKNLKEVKQTYSTGYTSVAREKKSGPILMSMPIHTVIQGSLPSVENFLIDLEQYKKLLSVKNVKISVKKYPAIEGDFTLTAFVIEDGS